MRKTSNLGAAVAADHNRRDDRSSSTPTLFPSLPCFLGLGFLENTTNLFRLVLGNKCLSHFRIFVARRCGRQPPLGPRYKSAGSRGTCFASQFLSFGALCSVLHTTRMTGRRLEAAFFTPKKTGLV